MLIISTNIPEPSQHNLIWAHISFYSHFFLDSLTFESPTWEINRFSTWKWTCFLISSVPLWNDEFYMMIRFFPPPAVVTGDHLAFCLFTCHCTECSRLLKPHGHTELFIHTGGFQQGFLAKNAIRGLLWVGMQSLAVSISCEFVSQLPQRVYFVQYIYKIIYNLWDLIAFNLSGKMRLIGCQWLGEYAWLDRNAC